MFILARLISRSSHSLAEMTGLVMSRGGGCGQRSGSPDDWVAACFGTSMPASAPLPSAYRFPPRPNRFSSPRRLPGGTHFA